jgi:hypothetical protein
LFDKSIIIEKALNKTATIPKNLQSQSGEKHLDDILSVLKKIDEELHQYNKLKNE